MSHLDEDRYYPVKCPDCGWTGSSKDCDGGLPIADTGDFSDIRCPCCESTEIDEDYDEKND